jgi:hypothetical protein
MTYCLYEKGKRVEGRAVYHVTARANRKERSLTTAEDEGPVSGAPLGVQSEKFPDSSPRMKTIR